MAPNDSRRRRRKKAPQTSGWWCPSLETRTPPTTDQNLAPSFPLMRNSPLPASHRMRKGGVAICQHNLHGMELAPREQRLSCNFKGANHTTTAATSYDRQGPLPDSLRRPLATGVSYLATWQGLAAISRRFCEIMLGK